MAWQDDGLPPEDTDNDGQNDRYCGDELTVYIDDPVGESNWRLGMVRSADDADATEACRTPAGDTVCHLVGTNTTLSQVTGCDPSLLQSGTTTLLDASLLPTMGWYLEDPHGFCFVGGAGMGFWDGLGCVELP